ncbi:MAG: aspartate aminotransferase family protein [Cyanothece sp. SIO2G6]|nr:aspartate aminotransferase family protein [Cyanothece sp. SIO2G6]
MSLETLLQAPPVSGSSNAAFSAETFDQAVMSTYGRFPLALERGAGCRVWDVDGKEYLDFVAGIATCTLGHAHPVMVETVTQQMQTLHHVSNLYYVPQQGALAQWLTSHSCADRAFFCNSGAEANEAAIKLARKYAHTVRNIAEPVIITANASFHGRTLATVTATGQPKYQKNFSPLVPGFHYVPYNDLAALEAAIATLDQDSPRVAAIMLEPLQGEGGVNPGDRVYFQRVRELCTERNILLMIDEVQAGMGRTGCYWGHEMLDIEADVFTSAKGLGGGVPIGAMLCQEEFAVFQPGDHASTYGGNPFVCAVALAVCQTLERENILANVRDRGDQLRAGLQGLIGAYPAVFTQVRGWGLINGLVLSPDTELTALDVVKAAMDSGLLLVPAGPKVVRLVPPLIVSEAEVEEAIAIVQKTLEQLL